VLRIIVVGAVLAALMIGIKDERILQRTHIVGSCSAVPDSTVSSSVGGSEWHSCVPGRLTGRPGLTMDGCTDFGLYRNAEFWQCPAKVTADPTRE